jgi:hypothetical protein
MTFSRVRALLRSPLILILPVMKAVAGAISPEKSEKELRLRK